MLKVFRNPATCPASELQEKPNLQVGAKAMPASSSGQVGNREAAIDAIHGNTQGAAKSATAELASLQISAADLKSEQLGAHSGRSDQASQGVKSLPEKSAAVGPQTDTAVPSRKADMPPVENQASQAAMGEEGGREQLGSSPVSALAAAGAVLSVAGKPAESAPTAATAVQEGSLKLPASDTIDSANGIRQAGSAGGRDMAAKPALKTPAAENPTGKEDVEEAAGVVVGVPFPAVQAPHQQARLAVSFALWKALPDYFPLF